MKQAKGFTLIELIVVVVLLGLIFSFAAPRFRDTILSDSLKNATRKMVNLIRNTRNVAVRQHLDYLLFFDLEKNEYWYETGDMTEEERTGAREKAEKLPDEVRITDIWIRDKGKEMGGNVSLKFRKEGYTQQSAIHLESEDGKNFTIAVCPFIPKVEVLDDYVEFENR